LRAPTRAFLRAIGQDDDDIAAAHVGVIHTGGEMSPCNTTLRDQAQHAKAGIYAGGGTPHECPVVSVSDGLSVAHPGMRFSLISRELIADSVEATDARPPVGRHLRPRRLRQEHARPHHGHGPLQRAGRLPVRRRRPAWGMSGGRDVNIVDTYEMIGQVIAGRASEAMNSSR
jgi:dihydroxy-acid dehydratase